jgi:hypothetical protein
MSAPISRLNEPVKAEKHSLTSKKSSIISHERRKEAVAAGNPATDAESG